MKPSTRTARLGLEALDERLVPSTTQVNLMSRGAYAAEPGFIAFQGHTQAPRGSHLDSFLGLDGPNGRAEQGYNTDARPLQFNENRSRDLTHSINLGDVPVVSIGGVNYREFLLDINEGTAPKLSVDEVRIFLGDRGNLRATAAEAAGGVHTLAGRTAVFDLDSSGDVALMLDARVKAGNGFGDMTLLVPDADFAGASVNDFVYLYTKMGVQPGAAANGGSEDWGVRVPRTPAAPPPANTGTASLAGFVTVDGTDPQQPIANATVHLFQLQNGAYVEIAHTQTDSNGAYSFTGLAAGTYQILVDPVSGYDSGNDLPGNIDGNGATGVDTSTPNQMSNILLSAGQTGTDFDFTERVQNLG